MPGVSELARAEEEAAVVPEGQQSIDIGELLTAIKFAYKRMSNQNSHKGLLVTCGSLIIHLVEENAHLKGLLQAAIVESVAAESKVTLT